MRFTAGVIVGIVIGRPVLAVVDRTFGSVVYHAADKALTVAARGFESVARYIDDRIEKYDQEGEDR